MTDSLRSVFCLSNTFNLSRISRRAICASACLLLLCSVAVGPLHAQTANFAGAVTTLSGSFNLPHSVAVDASGNVYVADNGNSAVKEIPAGCATSSCVTTLGGGFNGPQGVAVDATGNVYVADTSNSAVKEMTPGCASSSCVKSLGAGFLSPAGVAVGGSGNIFVADSGNNAVKEMASSCTSASCVTTLGGGFINPSGVAVNTTGTVYIADTNNNAVKEMASSCAASSCVTTLGGGFSDPSGVAVDATGNVYVADSHNDAVKEMAAGCASSSCVTTLGGGFSDPSGTAVDGSGNVYAGDTDNNALKEIMPHGVNAGTVAVGKTGPAQTLYFTFTAGGSGISASVLTQGATGLDFADAGTGTCDTNLASHVYDAGGQCTVVVKFTPRLAGARYGAVELLDTSGTLLATGNLEGTGAGPMAVFANTTSSDYAPGQQSNAAVGTGGPNCVAVDASGDLFVTDLAGNAVEEFVAVNGSLPASPTIRTLGSGFSWPYGVAVDGSGNVFIGDRNNDAVKEIVAAGGYTTVKTLGGGFAFGGPNGVAVDANDNVFVADWNNNAVYEILAAGGYTTVKTVGSGWESPDDVAVDGNSNVFVADFGAGSVREIMAAGGYTTMKTLVSGLSDPSSVAVDASGDLFVTSWSSGVAQEIFAAGGYTTVKTLASGFSIPNGLTLDGSGNVYVADQGNSRVVKLDYADPPSLVFLPTAVGQTSTDSPQTVTVQNAGNAALTFSGVSYPADFPQEANGTDPCTSSTSLDAGENCNLSIDFIPQSAGTLNESLLLTDNALNVTGAQQSISLSSKGTLALPSMTTPTPGSTLSGASATFTWNEGGGFSEYEILVGTTGPGSSNIDPGSPIAFATNSTNSLSATVSGIPTDGVDVYVTLGYMVNGAWQLINYTYTEYGTSTVPSMTTPAPSSTLSGASATFTWSEGVGPTQYQLLVGTTGAGSTNIYNGGAIPYSANSTSSLSVAVSGIPEIGATLYVTLGYYINGAWQFINYTYAEVDAVPAMMTPAPGSTLGGASATFTWNEGIGPSAYLIRMGTNGPGSMNIYNGSAVAFSANSTNTLSLTVNNIPTDLEPVYVTLGYYVSGAWQFINYTYTAYSSGTTAPPSMTTPAPGTTLSGPSATFTWNEGAGASDYLLRVGTNGPGSMNIYSGTPMVWTASSTNSLSVAVSGIPANEAPLYVTLCYMVNGAWQFIHYAYTEAAGPAMITPAPGSSLSGASVAFTWNEGTIGSSDYLIRVGTNGPGSMNIWNGNPIAFAANSANTLSVTVNNIPTDLEPVYVTLGYELNGAWQFINYTYTAYSSGTAAPPTMTTPAPNSTLSGASATFTWNEGAGPSEYLLRIGTNGPGSLNIYSGNPIVWTANSTNSLSIAVSGIPENGAPVYVTLCYYANGAWQYIHYTYTAATSSD
jgi:streptogramin lyase